MKLVGRPAVDLADARKGVTNVVHPTANTGQRIKDGVGCDAMIAKMGSAFRCYAIKLSRAFVLALRVTDLFEKRQCGIDHAWARAVEATRTFLDCLDELIAMSRLAFQKHQNQQLKVRRAQPARARKIPPV